MDPYFDIQTGVLRNRLGITDKDELIQAETELASGRSLELDDDPIEGDFDLAHLQAIHGHLFQDVYDWAGQIRTVNIGKGGTEFTTFDMIRRQMADVHSKIADEYDYLTGIDSPRFVHRVSEVYNDVNFVHPFREGNGRTQRIFISQLSEEAGYDIDWDSVDPEENIDASKAGLTGVKRLMSRIVTPLEVEKKVRFELSTHRDTIGAQVNQTTTKCGAQTRSGGCCSNPARGSGRCWLH